jgi:hypothetical protein
MNEISTNQAIAPTSTLTAGLFKVPGVATKLADLVNASGVKLGSLIPASALTVFVHSAVNHGGNLIVEKPGGSLTLVPQSNCELSVADLESYSIRAETPGDAISVRYTRFTQDRE